MELENLMGKRSDKVELATKHHFAHGVYARELFIPKGCTLTGKIHRYSCINVILKGKILVGTESGSERVEGPTVVISPPGVKRMGYAITDTIWITFHHSEQTDPQKVEDEVIAKDYIELENSTPPKYKPMGLTPTEQIVLYGLLAKQSRSAITLPLDTKMKMLALIQGENLNEDS